MAEFNPRGSGKKTKISNIEDLNNYYERELQEGEERTDLRRTDLQGAKLTGADLRGADLRGVDLTDAILRDADLRGANLTFATLIKATLTGAKTEGTDFDRATLFEATAEAGYTDFKNAKNLETATLSGLDVIDDRIESLNKMFTPAQKSRYTSQQNAYNYRAHKYNEEKRLQRYLSLKYGEKNGEKNGGRKKSKKSKRSKKSKSSKKSKKKNTTSKER